jgi:hypothetical protein
MPMSMEKSEKVLLVALTVFTVSFFLPAIWVPHVTPHTETGYWCAYATLVSPWTRDGLGDLREAPVEYISILLSGWINPLFLISMLLSRREGTRKLSRMLRRLVLLLMAACWVVFVMEHVYPFVAYFFWTAAMIGALFSGSFSSRSSSHDPQKQAAASGQ